MAFRIKNPEAFIVNRKKNISFSLDDTLFILSVAIRKCEGVTLEWKKIYNMTMTSLLKTATAKNNHQCFFFSFYSVIHSCQSHVKWFSILSNSIKPKVDLILVFRKSKIKINLVDRELYHFCTIANAFEEKQPKHFHKDAIH